jgi:peptidoglycan/LPS O-acetylase OafA/YrhL
MPALDDRNAVLDGIRGVAIALVVGYHAFPTALPGGFVGVSAFFTLSGFLITSRLLAERDREGGTSLVGFWSGRVRRLLPAAILTIAVTYAIVAWRGELTSGFGAGATAALLNVRNWWQLADGGGYGALFERADPLDHFWSLAIEEQFYLLFPIAFVLLARRRRGPVLIGLATVAALVFVLPGVFGLGFETRYLSSHLRIGEILVGVALAFAVAGLSSAAAAAHRGLMLAGIAGVPAVVGITAVALLVDYGSPFFLAGFAPIALLTVIGIASALSGDGNARLVLGNGPLSWLGRISYSLYLVHWPLLVLFGDGTTATGIALVAASVVVAHGLHLLVERPLMVRLPRRPLTLTAGAVVLAVCTGAVVVTRPTPERDFLGELSAAARDVPDAARAAESPPTSVAPIVPTSTAVPPTTAPIATAAAVPPTTASPPATTADPADLPTLGYIGDSVALSLLLSTQFWNERTAHFRDGPTLVELGCGVVRFPTNGARTRPDCPDVAQRVAEIPPGSLDVAIVASCQWELVDRPLPGDATTRSITDPSFRSYVATEYERVARALLDRGVEQVLWTACAPMSQVTAPPDMSDSARASRAPERVAALNEVVTDLSRREPQVTVLPLDRLLAGHIDDPTLRPDGSHVEFAADVGFAEPFGDLVVCALAHAEGCRVPSIR